MHKLHYIYITIKFQQIFAFFRPFLLHSYNTYYVRVGGAAPTEDNANGYISTQFTVGDTKVLIGDANGDKSITAADLSEIAKDIAEFSSSLTDNKINTAAAAYCNGDDAVTAADLSEIAKFIAEFETVYVNKTVDLGTYPVIE